MAERKPRPKTGEKRKTNQPLKIDRLPPAVHDVIIRLRNQLGKTWQEIEEISAQPLGEKSPGFVDWENLPTAVLELFPEMRIPHSNLQRWYDLRVTQVQSDVLHRSGQAQILAKAFAKAGIAGDDEAVIHASRDIFMGILAQDSSDDGRWNAAKGLTKLAEVMQKANTNKIRERKVATEERRIKLLEQKEKLAIQKLEAETDRLTKKAASGQVITAEDLAQVRKQTFGF